MEKWVNIFISFLDWIKKSLENKIGTFVIGMMLGCVMSYPFVINLNEKKIYLEDIIARRDLKIEQLELKIENISSNHFKQWEEMLTLLVSVESFLEKRNNDSNKSNKTNQVIIQQQNDLLEKLQYYDNINGIKK